MLSTKESKLYHYSYGSFSRTYMPSQYPFLFTLYIVLFVPAFKLCDVNVFLSWLIGLVLCETILLLSWAKATRTGPNQWIYFIIFLLFILLCNLFYDHSEICTSFDFFFFLSIHCQKQCKKLHQFLINHFKHILI